MKLVDFTVEARFKDSLALIKNDSRISIAKKLNAQGSKELEKASTQGIQINLGDERSVVTVERNRYAISVQDSKAEKARRKLDGYLDTINDSVSYNSVNVKRLGIRTAWIHKCVCNIDVLKDAFKEKFFIENSLLELATDYSVNLTLKDGRFVVLYLSGPIAKEEPIPLVTFPVTDLNEANVFVSADYSLTDIGKVKRQELKRIINDAFSLGQQRAEETLKILGVG